MSKRGLSDEELWYELMRDDEDDDFVADIEESDESEQEDNVEQNVGNISDDDYVPESHGDSSDDSIDSNAERVDTTNNVKFAGRLWKYVFSYKGKERTHNILRQPQGLTQYSTFVDSILDCFHLFVTKQMIELIVKYTNQKGEAHTNKKNKDDTQRSWQNVDNIEIEAFIGILILAGRFRESRECPSNLWNTNTAFSRPIYAASMSRNRFIEIMRFIRFDDFSTRAVRKQTDKLAPIREVTDILVKNCRESYNPSAKGTVDEQLVSFRGRCPFRVYMPNKPGKYGMKIWALCDAESFYFCNFEVYLGKQGNVSEKNQGQRVVKTLTEFWNGSGRNITTDNFFTDITLAEYLLQNNLTLIGTVRKNKKDLPKCLLDIASRTQYSSHFLFTKDVTLVSYVTKNTPKKCVVMLSTMHHEHEIAGESQNFKPEIILEYNKTKIGVDVLDKLIREYSCKRATRRWPLRLFMNFLDIACYNAFVIWTTKFPNWNGGSPLKSRRKIFLETLANALVKENIDRRTNKIKQDGRGYKKTICLAIEATGRSLPKNTSKEALITGKRGRCQICRGKDNKYAAKCDQCNKFICSTHSIIIQERILHCSTCSKDEDGEL